MNIALAQLISATLTAAVFLAANCALEKKVAARGRYLVGVILAVSFLLPVKIPLFRVEIPESKAEKMGFESEAYEGTYFFPIQPELPEFSENAGESKPSPAPSAPVQKPAEQNASEFSFPTEAVVWAVYALGASITLFCILYRYCRAVKALRRCGRAPSKREGEIFAQLCKKHGLRKNPTLLVCPCFALGSSVTFGVVRQTVIIADKFAEEDFALILEHELTHCKRKDAFFKAVLALIGSLYWFNPIMHLFIREMEEICEQSCDEKLLKNGGIDEKKRYCRLLIETACMKKSENKMMFSAFKGGKVKMKKRLNNIITEKNKKVTALVICAALSFVAISSAVYAVVVPETTAPNINVIENTTSNTIENISEEEKIKNQIAERESENLEGLDEESKEGIVNFFYGNTVYARSQGQITVIGNQIYGYNNTPILIVKHNGKVINRQGSARAYLAEDSIGVNIVDQPDGTVVIEVMSTEDLVNEMFESAFIYKTIADEEAYYAHIESEEYKQWLETRTPSPYWGTYDGPFLNLERFTKEDGTYDYQKFYETRHLYDENWYEGTLDLEGEYWTESQLFWKTLFARIGVTVE